MYTRDGVLIGKTVTLRAIFTDDTGALVAPDALPVVHFYDPSVDLATVQSEAEAATWTSETGPSVVSTEVAPGLYEVDFTVNTGWEEGYAHDVWDAAFNAIRDYSILSFRVEDDIAAAGTQLNKNEILTLTLDSSISSLDGEKTLGGDVTFAWATQLEPFCVSVELVQMTLGPWVTWIPPQTLALMIYWSSLLATHLTPPRVCDQEWYRYAKAQFVIYDIALKAYQMPGSPGSTGGGTKRLGDLSIKTGGSSGASGHVLSSGIDLETVKEMRRLHQEWFRVVNSGACLLPGQQLPAGFAIPGWNAPGRMVPGRMFEDPASYPYQVPTQNEKYLPDGHYRTKHRYRAERPAYPGMWKRW